MTDSKEKEDIKLMKNKDKNFFSCDEAAKFLGIHRTTLLSWMRKDMEFKKNNIIPPPYFKCPPYGRMNRYYRFKREDIEKFLKESMEP